MQAELLTLLSRRPEAIAQLEKLATVSPSSMPPLNMAPLLADPAMRPLWYDPTIEPFFRRIGLIDYWRSSGTRPDVCRKPGAPAFCRLLAN
jgi:hypothetical protein